MPYILPKDRSSQNEVVKKMIEKGTKADGKLNYVLFKLCKIIVKPSYNNYKNYCGELRQCATEIERKLLAPYEDKKEQENGPVKKEKIQ